MKPNRKLNLVICGQLILSCLFLCGWTYTLKTNTPAFDDDPREADDRMREIKGAFVERLDVDHYFYPSTTSTYDAADAGKHRYVTFREPNDLTSMAADESALFSKDVSSVTELHWIDESDNVLQLTSGGTLNIVSADLLGTLANNTYFTAVDAAGTGTVDLIKADANDVAVVPDNSQTATNAAPTSTTGIVNKKYVDDQDDTKEDIIISQTASDIFGTLVTTDSESNAFIATGIYKAPCCGIVRATITVNYFVYGLTGSANPPTNLSGQAHNHTGGPTNAAVFEMHVAKDEYWEVNITGGATTISWRPIGTGACVKQ